MDKNIKKLSILSPSLSVNTQVKKQVPATYQYEAPICILPNLYLYWEPLEREIEAFDIIINVAKEIKPLRRKAYYHLPWQHNQQLTTELPYLCNLIESKIDQYSILVHCQQGVSRSASLVIAYVMKSRNMEVNEAYAFVKGRAPGISPNMSLIYQLCEWGRMLKTEERPRHRRSLDTPGGSTATETRKRAQSEIRFQ